MHLQSSGTEMNLTNGEKCSFTYPADWQKL